jgi:predicted DsbA family dithiol-disulfide isomerase
MNALSDPAKTVLNLEVYSDAICPWCYIGKRRFEKAQQLLGERYELRIAWRPFELNPSMPPEGMDRKAYRSAKFGSWAKSQALDAEVAREAASEGLIFAHAKIERTPNTFESHRLVWLAGTLGRQDAVVEAIFRAYFVQGKDIGDESTLVEIAATAGLDRHRVARFLASDEGRAEVREEAGEAQRLGLRGVPLFVLNGKYATSGAVNGDTLAATLKRAAESKALS